MHFREYVIIEGIEDTKRRLFEKITTTGINVWRGERKHSGQYASDPGDFGRGIYYSTRQIVAKQYGKADQSTLKLENPLVITVDEAYKLADQYVTVRLSDERYLELFQQFGREGVRQAAQDELLNNAERLTRDMLAKGHDGMVVINPRGKIEIVDYRSYQSSD